MALRKLGRIVGTACLLALGLIVLRAAPAAACSCAGPMSAGDYLRQADVAFLGDVIAERIAHPESVIQGEARLASPEMIYTLDVQEVYKGSVTERQEVSSSLDGASCGAGLQVNHRYVVYATQAEPEFGTGSTPPLYTGLCHGTYEPDGVNAFPLSSGEAPTQDPHAPPSIRPGEVRHAPASSIGLGTFGGLMLLSGAIAAALIVIAGRT